MGDNSRVECDMAVASKVEDDAPGDATPSSIESTPEPEAGPDPPQEPAEPVKRKGGRKPIYATSEERKQRNRQAQAAFRERRTEYIKQLEATIKTNEETLGGLQQQHRQAADECLMLRYKNSLLERILLEKGINVQAELQMKTGSPVLGPGFMHSTTPMPQLQRTTLQRAQARRSGLPKLAPGHSNSDYEFSLTSPLAHPTPSSHGSSPSQMSMRSPAIPQMGMTSPASAVLGQPQGQPYQSFAGSSQQQPSQPFYQPQQHAKNAPRYRHHRATPSSTYRGRNMSSGLPYPGSSGRSAPPSANAFYPRRFQKHFEQLDQEYASQQHRTAFDNAEDASQAGTEEQFSPQFDQPQAQQHGDHHGQMQSIAATQQQVSAQSQYEPQQAIPPTSHPGTGHYDSSDPMLDADPFGLSASMHYPQTYFSQQYHGQR